MPGPTEPNLSDINHYLEPLVDELIELYEGIKIPTYEQPSGTIVRAALLMTACDTLRLGKSMALPRMQVPERVTSVIGLLVYPRMVPLTSLVLILAPGLPEIGSRTRLMQKRGRQL